MPLDHSIIAHTYYSPPGPSGTLRLNTTKEKTKDCRLKDLLKIKIISNALWTTSLILQNFRTLLFLSAFPAEFESIKIYSIEVRPRCAGPPEVCQNPPLLPHPFCKFK